MRFETGEQRRGPLVVLEGMLRFVWEEPGGDEPLDLVAGDSVIIPPDTRHRVEPGSSCRFAVEFYG
jgi:mannose-6-phosphate isomerase-like protein (cupin superfamily)